MTVGPGLSSIEHMLQGMSQRQADACAADARAHGWHDTCVDYPRWYLKRWHFLPEGYLSRRSAWGYEAVIRPVYHVASEAQMLRSVVARAARQAPARILDLGCGPGHALQAFARAFPAALLTGVDLSPFLLERAEATLAAFDNRVRLVHGDATRLQLEDEAFDAAFAAHLIGHLPVRKAAEALAEARRTLRPGGRLYLIDHAWHPTLAPGFRLIGERRLNGGIIRFRWLERA